MADPAAALAETRRVLRDGGRLAFSVWGAARAQPVGGDRRGRAGARAATCPPEPGAPGIFAMAEPDRIRELVTGAGFAEPRIEEVEVEWPFDDFEDYWRFLNELAGRLALVVEKLNEDEQQSVREAMVRNMEPFRSNGGYVFEGRGAERSRVNLIDHRRIRRLGAAARGNSPIDISDIGFTTRRPF